MPSLICPLCQAPLVAADRSYRCASGHAFDLAREGYLNLLPVQQRKSLAPGDNPEMVLARRAFLEAGHYAPLRSAVVDELVAGRDGGPAAVLLDIGCGEGYYTAAMAGVVPDVTGIDISKPAIQRAAKRHPGITWLVASSARLPLATASVDIVCSLFSPLPAAEMRRVLRPGGTLLVATPAPDHLLTLREALFDEVQPHRPEKFVAALATEFALETTREVRVPLSLASEALQQLLLMTPYGWRAKPERRGALVDSGTCVTTAAFTLYRFRCR